MFLYGTAELTAIDKNADDDILHLSKPRKGDQYWRVNGEKGQINHFWLNIDSSELRQEHGQE